MAKFHFFVLEDSRGFYETNSPTKSSRKVDIFLKTSNFVELDGSKDKHQTVKENEKFHAWKLDGPRLKVPFDKFGLSTFS